MCVVRVVSRWCCGARFVLQLCADVLGTIYGRKWTFTSASVSSRTTPIALCHLRTHHGVATMSHHVL